MKSPIANLSIALTLAGVIGAGVVQAETFSGKLNGHGCAHGGHTCPVDKLDPHLRYEPDFVLQQSDGTYYFLRNLPRDTKVRYVLEEVKASGKLNNKSNSIVVDEFMVKKGGDFKTAWSQRAQDDAYDYIYGVVCRGIWDRCLSVIGTGKRWKTLGIWGGGEASVSSVKRGPAQGRRCEAGTRGG